MGERIVIAPDQPVEKQNSKVAFESSCGDRELLKKKAANQFFYKNHSF